MEKTLNPPEFLKNNNKNLEQYFFSENVLKQFTSILKYEENILCLCTPSVADAFYRYNNQNVFCIDIDSRFSYLKNFILCDITKDKIELNFIPNIIIVDPPFFKMKLIDLYNVINKLTKSNKNSKLMIAYVIREDKNLLYIFKDYNLKLTKFKLEYQNVESNKWENYGLYTNFEIGKIKFAQKSKK